MGGNICTDLSISIDVLFVYLFFFAQFSNLFALTNLFKSLQKKPKFAKKSERERARVTKIPVFCLNFIGFQFVVESIKCAIVICHFLYVPNEFHSVHLNEMMRTTGKIKLSTMIVAQRKGVKKCWIPDPRYTKCSFFVVVVHISLVRQCTKCDFSLSMNDDGNNQMVWFFFCKG